jgi:hypothetical protein
LLPLLCDDCGSDGYIVFAGADPGQQPSPRDDLLPDLERHEFAEVLYEFVVVLDRIAVLDVFKGRKSSSVTTTM